MHKGFIQTKVDSIKNFFDCNIGKVFKSISFVIFISAPFVSALHLNAYPDLIGGTIAIVLIQDFLCYIFYELSKFYGAEIVEMPVPSRRFTTVDKDGMVSVPKDRMQEMIIYVSEVEDYLTDIGRI